MPNSYTPPSADYAISPVEGTQVVRVAEGGPNKTSSFAVHCCCGFKAGPFVGAEMAEYVREQHEALCLWPS